MTTNRRIFTPVAVSIVSGVLVALAAVGGSVGDRAAAAKTDRFTGIGDAMCAARSAADLSDACLAWAEGEAAEGAPRYVTVASTDTDAGVTTLIRLREAGSAY